MELVIKVCPDPHCEAVYHNCPKKVTHCNDCGGHIITVNLETYQKKFVEKFYQYDWKSMDYYRPQLKA